MPMQPIRTLYVHGAEPTRAVQGMLDAVREPSLAVQYSKTVWEAGSQLLEGRIEVVLLDLKPRESPDLNSLTCLHAIAPEVPIFAVSIDGCGNLALRSMQAYAENCVDTRRLTTATLRRSIWHAVQRSRSKAEVVGRVHALQASEANFRSLATCSSNGIVVVAKDGQVVFANAAATRLLGRPFGELNGEMLGFPFTDEARRECATNRSSGVELDVVTGEWDGAPVWFASVVDVATYRRDRSLLEAANIRLQRMNRRLGRLAKTDPLTELLNRRGLRAALAIEVARRRRSGRPLVSILLDCDDFKSVNDSLGHSVGDSVLKQVARRLQEALRPSDVIGRVGGDEFVVLLPETPLAEAHLVADRLRVAICGTPMRVLSKPVQLSVSLGLAEVSDEIASIDEVLVRTEAALQHSKQSGKNLLSSRDPAAAGFGAGGQGEKAPGASLSAQPRSLQQAARKEPQRGRPVPHGLLQHPSSIRKVMPRLPELPGPD